MNDDSIAARAEALRDEVQELRGQYGRAVTALRALIEQGSFCAYCGLIVPRKDVHAHIEVCDKHPLAALRIANLQTRAALGGLLDAYVRLVTSGGCGRWNPETDDVVMAARKALEKMP